MELWLDCWRELLVSTKFDDPVKARTASRDPAGIVRGKCDRDCHDNNLDKIIYYSYTNTHQ